MENITTGLVNDKYNGNLYLGTLNGHLIVFLYQMYKHDQINLMKTKNENIKQKNC